ncbi:uncharacterized protein VP01_1231g1, partial [Puccinia sorghi]
LPTGTVFLSTTGPSRVVGVATMMTCSIISSVVWIHVDDGVVTASSNRAMWDFQSILESKLSVTWDGNLHTIVGIKVERPSPDIIILSQPFLTDKILEKFTSALCNMRLDTSRCGVVEVSL